MENGVGIAEDAKLREGTVASATFDPRITDNVQFDTNGSIESDEDEIFEEAVEPETPIVESHNSVTHEDRNAESIENMGNKENTFLVAEAQKFEDVIEIPREVQNLEDSRDGVQVLLNEEQIAIEKVISDGKGNSTSIADFTVSANEADNLNDEFEVNNKSVVSPEILADFTVLANETDNLNDEFEVNNESVISPEILADFTVSANETENLNDEFEVNHESVTSPEKIADLTVSANETDNLNNEFEVNNESMSKNPEDFVSARVTSVESLTSEPTTTVDTATREVANLHMAVTQESSELLGSESDSENPDLEGSSHEIQDAKPEEEGDIIGSENPENGVLNHVNLAGTFNPEISKITDTDALEEQVYTTLSEKEDHNYEKEIEATNLSPESEPKSNGDVSHKDEQNVTTNEPVAIQDSEFQRDQIENTSHKIIVSELVGLLDSELQPEQSEKTSTNEVNDVIEKDERSFTSGSNLIRDETAYHKEPVPEDNNKGNTTSDTSDTNHVKENSQLDIKGRSQIHFTSSKSIPESSRTPQPELANTTAQASAEKNEEPEKEVTKIKNKEHSSSENKAKEIGTSSINPQPVSSNKPSAPPTAPPSRPAGLGRAAPLLEPSSRLTQHPRVNGSVPQTPNQLVEDPTANSSEQSEEYDETREKLQMIRVKFLRLAHRLGQTPHNVVVAQVLYRLGLAEQLQGRTGGRVAAFSFDRASALAENLEAASGQQEPLDFTCTIMVIGKSGVGKSATINSIFDQSMLATDAFNSGTKKVQEVVGTVQGIRVRVIDTPGLLPSWSDQCKNEKTLRSVKKFITKTPPDIVLYLDRLDMQSRDFGDTPLLRTITEVFGPSIWFNAIVVLTHAASAPPEGPNGTTTSYDMFVTQRSHVVQQAIRQAAGDMRLMNPVSLVENHSMCRTNRAGQRVLPNGQVWKPHLLLLSFASKILAEANTLLKLQDGPPGKPFPVRTRSPPLPFLLSALLQSRPEVRLPSDQLGDGDDDVVDDDDDDVMDDNGDEYDELPPFKSLTKGQIDKLSKVQRKAYYDELEYREKLFVKKQLKEEKNRRKMIKKMQEAAKNSPVKYNENAEEETGSAGSVPAPMHDLPLPASFDSDNPTHRYRSVDSSSWLVQAVLEHNGWDHDIGYEGITVEKLFVKENLPPVSFSGQISKDKKDSNLSMEVASSVKYGSGKVSSFGFEMQSVGKDMAYTIRNQTKFSNRRMNKATAGLTATLLGDVLTGGVKLEDKLIAGRRGQLVISGGAMYGREDVAYGGSLEATLRDKDHPLGRFLSTLGISVMDWHGDLAIGCNSQTQIPVGRHTNLIGRLNLNNKGSGQLSVRINSSEQLQIVLLGLIPLAKRILGYYQSVQQYG